MWLTFWIGYIIAAAFPFTSDAIMLDNAFCAVRPALVPVDPQNHDYFPYFVTLNRCSGSCNTVPPNIFHCVAKTQADVVVEAFSILSGVLEQVTLKNDTACKCECVVKADQCDKEWQVYKPDRCRCECKYESENVQCAPNFKWNQEHCECLCDLEPQPCRADMFWSPQDCRCRCSGIDRDRCLRSGKVLDEEDCVCVDALPDFGERTGAKGDNKWAVSLSLAAVFLFVILLVIVVVFVVADLYFNYCNKPSCLGCCYRKRQTSKKDLDVETDNRNHNYMSPTPGIKPEHRLNSYEVPNGQTNQVERHTEL